MAQAPERPDERAERLWRLGVAQTQRGNRDEARETLREAVRAAKAIPPNAGHTFPHPIIRIARAQAEAGDPVAEHQTFQDAVRVVAAEDEGPQTQNWPNMVLTQLRTEPRAAMADTFRAYRQFIAKFQPERVDQAVSLDAALSGDVGEALKTIRSPEFVANSPAERAARGTALLAVVSCFGPDERETIKPVLAEAHAVIDALPERERSFKPYQLRDLAAHEARLNSFAEAVATADSIVPDDVGSEDEPKGARGLFLKATAFVEIAERQEAAGDLRGARLTARRSYELAKSIGGITYRAHPLARATELRVRLGDMKSETLTPR